MANYYSFIARSWMTQTRQAMQFIQIFYKGTCSQHYNIRPCLPKLMLSKPKKVLSFTSARERQHEILT